jgi:hypothetical protein
MRGTIDWATIRGTIDWATIRGTIDWATIRGTIDWATIRGTIDWAAFVFEDLRRSQVSTFSSTHSTINRDNHFADTLSFS